MSLCDDVCSHCFWARLCGQNHEIVWKVRPNWAGAAKPGFEGRCSTPHAHQQDQGLQLRPNTWRSGHFHF